MKINSIKNGKIEKTYQQKTKKTKNIAVIIYKKKKKISYLFIFFNINQEAIRNR